MTKLQMLLNFILFNIKYAHSAVTIPQPIPNPSCANIIYTMPDPLVSPLINERIIAVSIYEHGSLLPLSISSKGAVLYFRLNCFERSTENTDAASVELITAPISKLSLTDILSTNIENNPVIPAVRITPAVESVTAFAAAGFAALHFVPKPP